MQLLCRRLLKPGFTLIEVIVSLGIFSLVSTLFLSVFVYDYNRFLNNIEVEKNYYYANEAMLYIQGEIRDSIGVKQNINNLIITMPDGEIETINLNNEKLQVEYKKPSGQVNTNNIVKNIKDFKVKVVNAVVYIKIITLDEEQYERCFPIKKVK